jgi:hypothetical protein
MRKLVLLCACCAGALMLSYLPPPALSGLPSLGISHAAAQVFPAHYRRTARRVYRRGYRSAARYGAAAATAGHYCYPYGYYGYGYGGSGYAGYRGCGGYGVYGPPFALYALWLSM